MRQGIIESAGIIEIWAEHEASFTVFEAMQTQWRIGMGGPTGLDYAVLPIVAQAMNVVLSTECFEQIRIMEAEALKLFGEHRKK